MKPERDCLRVGVTVILCAVILRLFLGDALGTVVQAFGRQDVAEALIYLETGRVVHMPEQTPQETTPQETTPSESTPPDTTPPETVPPEPSKPAEQSVLPVFSAGEGSAMKVDGNCDYSVDLSALVQQSRAWDLTDGQPAVLIVHTHGSESYVNQEGYQESSAYRTLDCGYNMVSIGDRVAEILEKGGVTVLHDRTLHDYPSYNDAYGNCRNSIRSYLEEYPSIRMVLDIHRDAATDSSGKEVAFSVQAGDKQAARIMLVVGTNARLEHPGWKKNLSLAAQLYAQLERDTPGICRSINLRRERFNQDMTDGSLLIEVGASGNTREEALLSAELLANSILAIAKGTNPG